MRLYILFALWATHLNGVRRLCIRQAAAPSSGVWEAYHSLVFYWAGKKVNRRTAFLSISKIGKPLTAINQSINKVLILMLSTSNADTAGLHLLPIQQKLCYPILLHVKRSQSRSMLLYYNMAILQDINKKK